MRGLWVVLLAIAFSVAVLVNVVSTNRSTRRIEEAVTRAQADRYRRALREELSSPRRMDSRLESFLEEQETEGLRYVSVAGPMRGFSAGEPKGEEYADGPERLFEVGGRHRYELSTPGRPPLRVAFEFEPQMVDGIEAETRRALWLAAIVALLAVLLAWAYRRAVLGRASLERELLEKRHLAVLGEMSTVLAHELRNPLTSLRGQAMLLQEELEGAAKAKADQIIEDATRIDRLSTDLLDFGGSRKLDLKETPLVELVERAVDADVTIDAEGAPAVWPLDARRFSQVMENLLENAVRATPEGGPPPRVKMKMNGDRLEIVVRDFGAGLPEGDPDSLFEPFVTHRTRGTGLGLAVVRRIVAQHGGEVFAENAPDGGALFRVLLPR